jgi:hypothetical protein
VADSIARALADAERSFTRPIPKTTEAQWRFLDRQAKGDTKVLAGWLGKSVRQVQRYRAGQARLPADAVRKATVERWQPRVRARARKAIAQNGITVSLRARFGYTAAPGTTDDARVRDLLQPLPPQYGQRLLDARTETERRQILAQGLGEMYFRDGGTRAAGLEVHLSDIDRIDIEPNP